jgi:glutamate-1-semialdehyde aminotransferase
LAERLDLLVTSATGTPGRVFFTNSGAEANECAIKLSRRHGQQHGGPERFHVLSAYNSFHGRTLATLAATGQPQKQETFQPLPEGFRQVEFADLDALRAAMDERACAVLLEAVQGKVVCSLPPPTSPSVACATSGEALLVIDEVRRAWAVPGVGSASSTVATYAPTLSRWRRHSATVFRSVPAGRARRSPPRSGPGITPRRSVVSPWPRARRWPCST